MNLLNLVLGPAADAYKAYQARKAQANQLDQALHVKKLDAMAAADTAEIALSIAQVNSAGWKDEWFTFVFSIPLIAAFIPKAVPYIAAGFAVLDTMPVWYKVYLGSAVAAAFGLHTVNKAWQWWHS